MSKVTNYNLQEILALPIDQQAIVASKMEKQRIHV